MSGSSNPFGFGKLVPGFDFLQNLVDSAARVTGGGAQVPGLANWIAPTLNVEDLERRISELKAVNFWLEQNSRALTATVQALELQKMTLSTLKGMNVAMGDVAQAFRVKPAPESEKPQPAAKSADRSAAAAAAVPSSAKEAAKVYAKSFESAPPASSAGDAPEPSDPATGQERAAAAAESEKSVEQRDAPAKPQQAGEGGAGTAPKLVDPMQWWGALTSQFQQIAANAMQGAANHPALDATRNMTAQAMEAANQMTASIGGAARKTGKATAAPAKKKSAAPRAAKKTGARESAAKASSRNSR